MLKPALARGEIQCIGATTLDEYRQNIEKDGALAVSYTHLDVYKRQIFFFLVTILANIFASEQKSELINHDNAIIMAPSVTVKSLSLIHI